MKYDLFQCFELWFNNSTFPTYTDGKGLSEIKSKSLRGTHGLSCATLIRTCMLLRTCLENTSIQQFWFIADEYPYPG